MAPWQRRNLSVVEGRLRASFGYVTGKAPSARAFKQGLADELADIERFLSGRAGAAETQPSSQLATVPSLGPSGSLSRSRA